MDFLTVPIKFAQVIDGEVVGESTTSGGSLPDPSKPALNGEIIEPQLTVAQAVKRGLLTPTKVVHFPEPIEGTAVEIETLKDAGRLSGRRRLLEKRS